MVEVISMISSRDHVLQTLKGCGPDYLPRAWRIISSKREREGGVQREPNEIHLSDLQCHS
jgi:hypothetical protein